MTLPSARVLLALGKIPLNPPFSKGEAVGMPKLIDKLHLHEMEIYLPWQGYEVKGKPLPKQ
ncbi:MAG: hypothetical protein BA872_04110 [Desulfobacterales bacterium C00003060]|nr:MAG: hypothetical protein BA872_04110 [Desulfobacterales bacterium C00003060]OEU80762.1 MAG: hypothetical protein BA865_07890 [Desulfobacterales bacterium S5133MH4]